MWSRDYKVCGSMTRSAGNFIDFILKHLIHTRMSLAEIAALCGYRSLEHFSRQFHRTNGKTPGEYRREQKEK